MPTVRGGTIINISGPTPIDDPEYRYKMPAVYGKIEGSGNGIKTAIPNITDVALSLHRQPGEVNKFFGTELGAQTRYNAETDRAIVNGAHTDAVLQELVHRYVEKFVLCPTCHLPETEYKVKAEIIYHKCAACGAKDPVDMTHKLCNYILAEEKRLKKEKGKDKKEKEEKKKSSKKEKEGSDEERKKAKKEKKKDKDKSKEKKSKKEKKEKHEDDDDKDYIKNALSVKREVDDVLDEDDEDSAETEAGVDDAGALLLAIEATKKYIEENPDAAPDQIIECVTNQQMASALKSHDKIRILVSAAFTSNFYKGNEIHKFSPAIMQITNGNKIMERHLIASLEAICVNKPKNFPVMIKQFYDEEVLDEEAILAWADEGRSEYTLDVVDEESRALLRGEAEPVVVWLQEVDSDGESTDDE